MKNRARLLGLRSAGTFIAGNRARSGLRTPCSETIQPIHKYWFKVSKFEEEKYEA
jgi:hypothetical protein